MNEENKKITDYINNLPKYIQDVIFDESWEERTIEIGKKYSLNNDQINDLINVVILILSGLEKPENFIEIIINDLNISKLLAEQIKDDIETRIFEQVLKQIEKYEGEKENNTENKEKIMSSGTQLELRPENFPMVEENEPVRVNPTPRPVLKNEILDKQSTIGVPRYGEQTQKTEQNPIIDKKLNTTTSSTETIKRYEKDPYREPIN